MTCVSSGTGTAYPYGAYEFKDCSRVCVGHHDSTLVYVVFCSSLFVLLSFLFWPLCWLSFFDLRILLPLWYGQNFLDLLRNSCGSSSRLLLYVFRHNFIFLLLVSEYRQDNGFLQVLWFSPLILV